MLLPVVFAFLFVDFFDTAGTLMAVGNSAHLINEDGSLQNDKKALLADSIGTMAGAVLGTSTVTSFVESTTGVESGARTGLSACVVSILFLLSLVLYPLFGVFGSVEINGVSFSPVTSLALVYVGTLMFKQIKEVNFDDTAEVTATFVTFVAMLLCYSISYGIAFGFLTYIIVMLAQRRGKQVSPMLYGLSVVFLLYIFVDMFI
jgi:AGZA family xanthine/uracil permease-like MFS transporter